VGDCWSFALMRGMLFLQCSGVRCISLPRARGVERRGFTSQFAHELDFDRQERRVGKRRACLLQCQRRGWQRIDKDQLGRTDHSDEHSRGNQYRH